MYLRERRTYVGKSGDKVRMRPAIYRGEPGFLTLLVQVVGCWSPSIGVYKSRLNPSPQSPFELKVKINVSHHFFDNTTSRYST